MAKYNYDKKALAGLGVGAFLGEVKLREQHIEAAKAVMPEYDFNPNRVSAKLHPHVQFGVITKAVSTEQATTFTIQADKEMGCEKLAYFRAGQYIAFALEFGGAYMCKPYTLSSAPKSALGEDSSYEVTIQRKADGYASTYILDNWKVGSKVICSGPLGNFYYQYLRDSKNVVALAGGSGITPFMSMAGAIADGTEDFNLTILYGVRNPQSIILKDDLEAAASKSNGKVKVVYVYSDEGVAAEGAETGFITAELIKKYAPDDYSIYVCGPKAMYAFAESEIAKLNLPKRKVRFELSGEYGDPTGDAAYPADAAGKTYNVTVVIRGEEQVITCAADETLLHACESAGIRVQSDCRSGKCGWCHSRLISGDVYIPEKSDGRRAADKKFGWIHPCSTYPVSDVKMEVFPINPAK